MIRHNNRKKKLIISYKNLPDTIRDLFKEAYPDGYKEYLQKTIKPNGEPIFVVPLETDDTSYMIKFDVKIDTTLVDDDIEKDDFSESEEQEGTEFVPLSEALDKEEGTRRVGTLQHGDYEGVLDGIPDEPKKEFEIATRDMAEEFADLAADDTDSYLDDEEEDDEEDEEDDLEPDDDELLDIEALLNEADSGEGMLREDNPPEEKRGHRKNSDESPDIKAIKAVRDAAKTAQKSTDSKSKKASAKAAPASKASKATAVKAEASKAVTTKATAAKATPAKTAPTKATPAKEKASKAAATKAAPVAKAAPAKASASKATAKTATSSKASSASKPATSSKASEGKAASATKKGKKS